MHFWLGGPRVLGLRTGVIFGPEDFRRLSGAGATRAGYARDESLIYVIKGAHDHLKIGVSVNPSKRIAELQTGSPVKLQFLYICAPEANAYGVEDAAHDLLDRFKVMDGGDEWFGVPLQMAVGAIAAAANGLGQKIVEIPIDKVDYVVAEAARRSLPKPTGNSIVKAFGYLCLAAAGAVAVFTVHFILMVR